MATLESSGRPTIVTESGPGIDIAGTVWPLYKIEALVVGLLTLITLFVVTADPRTGILGAAAATTLVWIARRLHHRRTVISSGSETPRAQ